MSTVNSVVHSRLLWKCSICFQRRKESVGYVFDFASVAVTNDRSDIEARSQRNLVDTQIGLGSSTEQVDFLMGHGVKRVLSFVTASLDFHECDILPLGGDDIYFKVVQPPVAFSDGITIEEQFLDNLLFSPFPKVVGLIAKK